MISTTSEYALRALCYLARQPQRSSVLGRELAREADVPANYLAKILLTLRRAGFISTARGTGGGYRQRRAAQRIRLDEIVELLDVPIGGEAGILGHQRKCSVSNPCSAHHAWRDVRGAYNHFLRATTLADISQEVAGPRS
jgi:Rrf2 family transcriptional regulator, iron-sulfur cluster assembly transcription factor